MSTRSLTGLLRDLDHWKYSSEDDIGTTRDEIADIYQVDWEDGTGDEQVNGQYRLQETLLSNTERELDMAGSLVDVFGQSLTFSTIKQIKLINLGTEATQIIKFGQLSTPTSGNLLSDLFDGLTTARVKVRHGGMLHIVAPNTGYTVTGGSADVILISNEGPASVEYKIVIKGVRA